MPPPGSCSLTGGIYQRARTPQPAATHFKSADQGVRRRSVMTLKHSSTTGVVPSTVMTGRPARVASLRRATPIAHPVVRRNLVSRSGDPFTIASNRVDDLVGGLGPLEGFGILVPELDPLFEGAGQLVDRAEDAPVEPTALQFSEPSLDLV